MSLGIRPSTCALIPRINLRLPLFQWLAMLAEAPAGHDCASSNHDIVRWPNSRPIRCGHPNSANLFRRTDLHQPLPRDAYWSTDAVLPGMRQMVSPPDAQVRVSIMPSSLMIVAFHTFASDHPPTTVGPVRTIYVAFHPPAGKGSAVFSNVAERGISVEGVCLRGTRFGLSGSQSAGRRFSP